MLIIQIKIEWWFLLFLVDTATIRPDCSESYWQGGVGGTAKIGNGVDVYADVRYQKALDGQMEGYSGNLGIKVSFWSGWLGWLSNWRAIT